MLKKFIIFFIFTLFIPYFAIAANILENSAFEVKNKAAWSYSSNNKAAPLCAEFNTDQNNTTGGSYSVKLYWNADDVTRTTLLSKIYILKPNTEYTISAYYYKNATDQNNQEFILELYDDHSSNSYANGATPIAAATEGSWTRVDSQFTTSDTAYYGYHVRIGTYGSGTVGNYLYIDDVQLEEAGSVGAYAPISNVELGFSTTKTGNVFRTGDTCTVKFNLFNGTGGELSPTINYQVYDFYNARIKSGSFSKTIAANTLGTQDINLSLGKQGIFRIIACVVGSQHSESEGAFSVVPVPRGSPTFTPSADYNFGIHSTFSDHYL